MHTDARDARDTDWSQVVALYDQLVRLDRSPVVALNRAVAVAEVDGPDVALSALDGLAGRARRVPRVPRHPRRAAAPAGPAVEARTAYDSAIALAGNTAETAYLARRRDELGVARSQLTLSGVGPVRRRRPGP